MSANSLMRRPNEESMTADSGPKRFRIRASIAALLLAFGPLAAGCTPDEIQQSIGALTISFEQGGLESGLSTAALIGQEAVLVVGMRLGSLGLGQP